MITFIPAWGDKLKKSGGSDDLIGQIKSFMMSETDYQIVIYDYLPSLRYFLHNYDLLESNYTNLYDELQETTDIEQVEIDLYHLKYPKDSTFIYAPFFVLVYQGEEIIGKVFLGEGGHIFEAHYFKQSKLEIVEIYDDRGFLSSRKIFNEGVEEYTELLDYKGEWIYKYFEKNSLCIINPKNKRGLEKARYTKPMELIFEIMEQRIEKENFFNPIIISVTEENINLLTQFANLSNITLSFFQDRYPISILSKKRMLDVVKKTNASIVDSNKNYDKLLSLSGPDYSVFKISPYDTRFELSASPELKEEVIYIELLDMKDSRFLLEVLITYLIKNLSSTKSNRKFELIFRVEKESYVPIVKNQVDEILKEYFPEEMSYLLVSDPLDQVDTEIVEQDKPKISVLNKVRNSIKILKVDNEEQLFKLISRTRLIVDVNREPSLLTQIYGISAGIPQINVCESEYVHHKKNGYVLKDPQELFMALDYYLEGLKYWQEARAFAVQQIKKFSGFALQDRLIEISKRRDYE